ncbi:hypothetical protein [Ciceribacter sp. L1K22]|uniref:hypothetical protein n=1 Tax=Ciceribacter sp. L1K22 TaxID=2820275 RepID=UPI001ABDD063|nr:hypothetical protein [Ciceribacter sp. L1K22]MBO3760118.1 hypothetical protein [Ciceribacter sp. L1K22]
MNGVLNMQIISTGTRLAATLALGLITCGCTTTAKDLLGLEPGGDMAANEPAADAATGKKPGKKGYVDPMVVNASGEAEPIDETADAAAMTQPVPGDPSQVGEVVMQPTQVAAGQSSIFSAQGAAVAEAAPRAPETPASLVPTGVPQHGYNAAVASLFSAPAPAQPPIYPETATVVEE